MATTISPSLEEQDNLPVSESLLSEIDRQRLYLSKLPKDFTFPLFNAMQALESQRRSGYRNTAAAAREIVDNSIEAGASQVHVVFDKDDARQRVRAVAFIDNGPGMLSEMARYALSWGGGTHFDEPTFIGKFGFGLPNASINQTRTTEVYTKTDDGIFKAELDINKFQRHGLQSIPEPAPSELPEFVAAYLKRQKWDFKTGTVVVWVNPDRLTYKKHRTLAEHLVDDFGVAYRYQLLKRSPSNEDETVLRLVVEDIVVDPVDPLFLHPKARYYEPPLTRADFEKPTGGGSRLMEDVNITLLIRKDVETGEPSFTRLKDAKQAEEPDVVGIGKFNVRVVRFPLGFAVAKAPKSKDLTVENRRFEVRKTRRGMAFVRSGREIQMIDSFPRSAKDERDGLGKWPQIMSYAYHWGIEILFEPELDEFFGIMNDKQGVRPLEDFWRILEEEEIDKAANREQNWQTLKRKAAREARKVQAVATDEATAAEVAASDADLAAGNRPTVPNIDKDKASEALNRALRARALRDAKSVEEIQPKFLLETHQRRYRVDFYDQEDAPFYKPEWVGLQIVVWVNRKHPFYDQVYQKLVQSPEGSEAKSGIDLLLMALGRAELMATEEDMKHWYQAQRKQVWSVWLENALGNLERAMNSLGTASENAEQQESEDALQPDSEEE